jgi:Domain of unknown function (DUF4407)
MRDFLIALSGARPELLKQCPTERGKFEGIGGTVLTTSVLATISVWFALTTALGINAFVAVLPAVGWGLAIMSLDRWLFGSIPAGGHPRWRLAVPRIAMAVLLGVVISTPLVLQIFRSEIDAQIVEIKQRRASAFLNEQQRNSVGQEVTKWRNSVAALQKTITSGGSVPVDASKDVRIQELTTSRNDAQKLADKHYKEWQCQLYGGKGCTRKGDGPLARASKQGYDKEKKRVADLNQQVEDRRKQLTATDEASKATRLQQAKDDLPRAQRQLDAATQRQGDLQERFDAENKATNGLLIRLQALDEVSGGNFTLNTARILLFLLLVLIECLPVTVKLMQRPGSYERVLEYATKEELRNARAGFSGRHTLGADERSRSLRGSGIWVRPTEMQADQDQGPQAAAPPQHRQGTAAGTDHLDLTEQTSLDHMALRNMEDTQRSRATDSSPGGGNSSGGTELFDESDDY